MTFENRRKIITIVLMRVTQCEMRSAHIDSPEKPAQRRLETHTAVGRAYAKDHQINLLLPNEQLE